MGERGEDEPADQDLEDDAGSEPHFPDEPHGPAHQHEPGLQPALGLVVRVVPRSSKLFSIIFILQ